MSLRGGFPCAACPQKEPGALSLLGVLTPRVLHVVRSDSCTAPCRHAGAALAAGQRDVSFLGRAPTHFPPANWEPVSTSVVICLPECLPDTEPGRRRLRACSCRSRLPRSLLPRQAEHTRCRFGPSLRALLVCAEGRERLRGRRALPGMGRTARALAGLGRYTSVAWRGGLRGELAADPRAGNYRSVRSALSGNPNLKYFSFYSL